MIKLLFRDKLIKDDRLINPLFTFSIGEAICHIIPPYFTFYTQLLVLLTIYTVTSATLGILLYKIVIEPALGSRRQHQQDHDRHASASSSTSTTSLSSTWPGLFSFGFALPFVILQPIYVINYFEIKHIGLRMVLLTMPIINSLRITEAFYGFTPPIFTRNVKLFCMYFSCPFGLSFDPDKEELIKSSRSYLSKQLKIILRDFIIICVIMSILAPRDWELFQVHHDISSFNCSLQDLLSWRHLINNYLVAVMLSISLSQSTTDISLLYNILYGYQTYDVVLNPMLRSKSPSDFWSKRWNLAVHKGLKNGAYKPVRKYTNSRVLAVIVTFVVSGIIHEYVNLVLFFDRGIQFEWKQILFFSWNGVLILLEYAIGGMPLFQWMSKSLPSFLVTAMVVSTALPLAHFFTGDWIKGGYFDAVMIAEPLVVCSSNLGDH